MILLKSTSLTGGSSYPSVLFQLSKIGALAIFVGALEAGAYVDRVTGRRWVPRAGAVAPVAAQSNGVNILRFAAGGALQAEDGADTFTSLGSYSILTVAKLPAAAGTFGGIYASNDLAASELIDFFDASSSVHSAIAQYSGGGSMNGAVNTNSDGAWHTHVISVDSATSVKSNMVRRDGIQTGVTSTADMTMSATAGGKRLLIGGCQNNGFLPFKGDLALMVVLGYPLHQNPTQLGIAEAAAATFLATL